MLRGAMKTNNNTAVLALMSVSILYFFSAFPIPSDTGFSSIDLFFSKLAALGCPASVIGILFLIQHWPNGKSIICVGLITMIASLAYILYQKNKPPETEIFSKFILTRLITLYLVSAGVICIGI
jgi:hypothetical protein